MTKKLISALSPLTPALVVDNKTGELLTQTEWSQSVSSLLDYCQEQTQTIFSQHKDKLVEEIVGYKSNANAFARQRGYASTYKDLPRELLAKSRINELVLHKLVSEVASYVKNPNPLKQEPTFPKIINLGAVNAQMVKLELVGEELSLLWKCWDKELLFVFKLPAYILQRDIKKISLPVVKLDKKTKQPVFIFTIQEHLMLRVRGKHSAGIDLGKVEPYTLAVTNGKGNRVAHYNASSRLRQVARKQDNLRNENTHLYHKINAYKALGLDSTILESHKEFVKAATTRLTKELALQQAAEIARKVTKHSIKILHLEDLSWVSGTVGSKIGNSRWAHSQQQEAITHATLRLGITAKTVNPKNTSNLCHSCGLGVVHRARSVYCTGCKSLLDRDFNAALNIANNINHNKRFPTVNGNIGNDCSSKEQVMGLSPNSALKDVLAVARILT